MDKKLLFHMYNILKQDVGVYPAITLSRLNKALGIAQRKNYSNNYYTIMTSCTCPDSSQRGFFVCKHRLALFMEKAQETLLMRFNNEGPWDPIYRGR